MYKIQKCEEKIIVTTFLNKLDVSITYNMQNRRMSFSVFKHAVVMALLSF